MKVSVMKVSVDYQCGKSKGIMQVLALQRPAGSTVLSLLYKSVALTLN
jgi:hypothetical protein